MSDDTLRTRVDGGIGWLTINREGKLNALTRAMWQALPVKLDELAENGDVRVIVIRGAGTDVFSAGADIEEFRERLKNPEVDANLSPTSDAFDAIVECSKPTIAMVHGHCFGGGCAIALSADIRMVSEEAQFAITPAKLGLGYPFNGVERAVYELGAANARYLLLTAERIDAADALRMGLAHVVHPAEALERETVSLAERMAGLAPLTLRAIRESIRAVQAPEAGRDLSGVERLIAKCNDSEDYHEGVRAFMERRKPKFEGR